MRNLVWVLGGVQAGPMTAERPAHEADPVDAAQGADVVHGGVDLRGSGS